MSDPKLCCMSFRYPSCTVYYWTYFEYANIYSFRCVLGYIR